MQMKIRNALLAATILSLPVVAHADPITGVYVGAGAGYNLMQDETLKGASPSNVVTQGGFVGAGSLGYGLGNGLRVELEGSYRDNKLSKVGSTGAFGMHGEEQKPSVFANVLYDFDASGLGLGSISPYVGAGAGYGWSIWKNVSVYSPAGSNPALTFHTNATQGDFAYQGILGAAFPIAGIPGLAVTAEYRFMGLAGDRSYGGTLTSVSTVAGRTTTTSTSFTQKVNDDFNHSFMLGLRYAFNAAPVMAPPAPAPVVAPAPAPARTYLVFFDWDRADLTARARSIIKEAADASTRVSVTQIKVNGYTDLSGTAAYNQRLSVRRAQAVAAELVRDGVARTAIAIQGFGESNPLVPTAQGVREPQNRRVEIILN
jgi:OOP family OmpA-OmpF porin